MTAIPIQPRRCDKKEDALKYCCDCRFYFQNGECHRYPPKLVQSEEGSGFPCVDDDNWCGEFQQADPIRPPVDYNAIITPLELAGGSKFGMSKFGTDAA
jgi:hypothetical protein